MRARYGLALAMVAGALGPPPADAQSFVILTQNMLRFGHGSRLSAQCDAITDAATVTDIIVLQEVMTSDYPCLGTSNKKGVNKPVPTGFTYVTSTAKGRSSYKEYYGILYRNAVHNNMQITGVAAQDNLSTLSTFMRPPYGVNFLVKDVTTNKACSVWIVDIHSIFGKKQSERQDEAAAMGPIYTTLVGLKTGAVLVAGDWNLDATDTTGFGWVNGNGAAIQPNVLTSLTTAGAPSSAYDHAVNTVATTLPTYSQITAVATYTGNMSMAAWRQAISDHMGVVANVKLAC